MKLWLALLIGICVCVSGAFAQDITPPTQPTQGYGGSDYRYAGVKATAFRDGAQQYWIFEPDTYRAPLPVIAFFHGWGAMDPKGYGLWLRHMVRRGAIVIYPRFQGSLFTPANEMTPNSIDTLKHAFNELKLRNPLAATDSFVVVGHSIGAIIAANIAALAAENGLPSPKAVFAVQPGKTWGGRRAAIELEDMRKIKSGTLLIAMVGDKDRVVHDKDAYRIYNETASIAPQDKYFITMRSDARGKPELIASHFSPAAYHAAFDMKILATSDEKRALLNVMRRATDIVVADTLPKDGGNWSRRVPEEIYAGKADALDYYGYWKTLDILMEAAIWNERKSFSKKELLSSLGVWSDGTPVTPMEIK